MQCGTKFFALRILLLLALYYLIPYVLRNNPQFGYFLNNYILFGSDNALAVASIGVFHPLTAVPYLAANINLIAEQTRSSFIMPINSTRRPSATARGFDAFFI